MRFRLILLASTLAGFVVPLESQANATERSGPVIARGAERDEIKSLDIHDRPDRPLHIYGNTVRRRTERSVQRVDPTRRVPRRM